jgi:hypothetical protein
MKKARLIVPIPPERVHDSCGDGSVPKIGDIVELDQGFTFPDGRTGGMVYCIGSDGRIKWGADVYDSEIEVFATNDVGI